MRQIGQYQLKTEIARGGMGEIYIAQDTRLNREVAVKVLMPSLATDPQFAKRFIREGQLVAPLEHPNIVPLYDYGVDPESNQPYLVMRLMRGGTLEDRLDEMSEEEIWRAIRQIGIALDYAHKNNVVHRDLKPSNILYDREGNAYLTDFGIALQAQSTETRLTQGGIIGTPHYMSPEQFRSGMKLDGKSDQYSFAVMIYELLAEQPLFEGDTMALLYQHLNEEPNIDVLRKKGFQEHIIAALLKALSKELEDRFESVGDFVKALQGQIAVPTKKRSRPAEVLEMEPTELLEMGSTELLEIGPTELLEVEPEGKLQPANRSKIWIYSIVGIVGVVGLAFVTLNWIQSRNTIPGSEVGVDESPAAVSQDLKSEAENTPIPITSADGANTDEAVTDEAPTDEASTAEVDNQLEGIEVEPSPTLEIVLTVTNSPTLEQTPEGIGEAEATPTLTPTPVPTDTPVPTPECSYEVTATEMYTYDDPANNSLAPAGINLRITFELLNSGTCEWESTFMLSHISGSGFGADGGTSLGQSVAAGESITVVVRDLVAPNSSGQYPSVWGLLTDEGVLVESDFEFELGVYARETATPVPTATVEQAIVTPTTEASETVDGEPVNFNASIGNCTYPGDGIEYRCDLVITPYGGVSGDTYTVWVNDADPMARYYPVTTTFTHFINARRCATYIHEVIVQSETTGERLSRNIFFDPNSNAVFPGGTTCSE